MTINHIGLSGGKDSTALWGWAINESGYPPESIRGSFCDTMNEYPEVYAQIKVLDEYGQKRGIAPVLTLHATNPKTGEPMGFLDLAKLKKRFPGARTRFCTDWLKIQPTMKHLEQFKTQGHDILAHSGVRAAESEERSKLEEYDFDKKYEVKLRRPLLQWSIADIWQAHQRYGLPINPLYFTGRKRVGCRLCIMSSKEDIRRTAKDHPEVIDEMRRWEEETSAHHGVRYLSFFNVNTIPEIQRTGPEITCKDGRKMLVATIDDVVRWSQTLRGGVQSGFDFMFEEDDDFDAGVACKSAMGHCE